MLKKNQIEMIVTVVLGVALLALAIEKFVPRQQSVSGAKAAAVSNAKSQTETDSSGPLYVILYQATKDFIFRRDPFNPPPLVSLDGPVKFVLMGIAWDPQTPRAIINNAIVQIGSTIADHVVVDIQENKVILNDGSSDLELTIPKFVE